MIPAAGVYIPRYYVTLFFNTLLLLYVKCILPFLPTFSCACIIYCILWNKFMCIIIVCSVSGVTPIYFHCSGWVRFSFFIFRPLENWVVSYVYLIALRHLCSMFFSFFFFQGGTMFVFHVYYFDFVLWTVFIFLVFWFWVPGEGLLLTFIRFLCVSAVFLLICRFASAFPPLRQAPQGIAFVSDFIVLGGALPNLCPWVRCVSGFSRPQFHGRTAHCLLIHMPPGPVYMIVSLRTPLGRGPCVGTFGSIHRVTKVQASRSRQYHTTFQHEQRSSGDLDLLRDFSLQPAVTFSFVIGSMRSFDYCILRSFLFNNTFMIHLPWHIVLLINQKSFTAFRNILHLVRKNICCFEFTSYASYHLHSSYKM
jgi:hypothetical protein